MHKGSGTLWLSITLALFACSSGEGTGSGAPSQVGGSASSGSSSGAGTLGVAGSSGGSALAGASAHGGSSGSAAASAGSLSSGGSPFAAGGAGANAGASKGGGGTAGSLGGAAAGGSGGKSASAAGGGNANAPTFTMIYNTIITPSCGGTQCHLKRPTPQGYDFSSKTAASSAWRSDVFPGDGAGSPLFQVLNFGIMPKDQPSLSVEQLTMVLDWIDAGALDN